MLHRSAFNLSGIVMNFGRGTPVAHTFIQTMADFGQPIIDLRPLGDEYDVGELAGENFRPMLNTDAAWRTAEFLKELLQFCHPDSMKCNWDRRIRIFTEGQAAMCYGWSIRAAAFERNEASPAHGNVAFVVHPPAPGMRPVSPIGGFSLTIPRGLSERRSQVAGRAHPPEDRPALPVAGVGHVVRGSEELERPCAVRQGGTALARPPTMFLAGAHLAECAFMSVRQDARRANLQGTIHDPRPGRQPRLRAHHG